MRPSRRAPDELRAVSLERGVVKYAEGSCLVKFGDTHVLVTATLEDRLPPWLKGQGRGWVTAEYGMLPRATPGGTRPPAPARERDRRPPRRHHRRLGGALRLPRLDEKARDDQDRSAARPCGGDLLRHLRRRPCA